ncbi:MAG TPA: phosphatase PAP2 family protein, partial [Labilithrix sp.]|nr:phosphatase PAP2 family protein [Labilithrix sp.]
GMAVHDWLLVGQLVVLLAFCLAGQGPTRALAVTLLVLDLAWLGTALALARGVARPSRAASAFYRTTLIAILVATYVQLRWILPVVASRSVDGDLFAFDLRVFGYEPALAWDRWVTVASTEWFAFFYYSYFFVLALHAVPIAMRFEDGSALSEFTFGVVLLYCVGHVGYALVPAFGPYVHAASSFERPLEGGFFWRLVQRTVEGAGAQKDVFPSRHTALPVFLALYSFRQRRSWPFNVTWPIAAFFASQIVLATMFLRWHWLIDIVAGASLALVAWLLGPMVTRWDGRRRDARALPPAFACPPFGPRR